MSYDIRPSASGGWLAFAVGPRLLVVPPTDDAFVTAAYAALDGDRGFQTALDLLTSKGLAATPAFVLVEWVQGRDARLIVRGDVAVTVSGPDGDAVISATDVSTWVERSLPATRLAVAVPSATPQGTASLPLERGVALVAEIAAGAPVAASAAAAPAKATPSAPTPSAPTTAAADAAPEPATPAPEPATLEPAPATPTTDTVVVPDFDDMRKQAPAAPAKAEANAEAEADVFGETVHRPAAAAPASVPQTPAGASESVGDHDGHTVLTSDIGKLRAGRKRAPKANTAPPPPSGGQLVLVLSTTGAREPLTQPILVGRSPSVSKISGGQIPRLVTVGSAEQDISRNHAQFVVEGGTVVVTDLHSKNGTAIVLPGKDAQKLRPGEPTSVIPGTVVDLGGGVTFTVDED